MMSRKLTSGRRNFFSSSMGNVIFRAECQAFRRESGCVKNAHLPPSPAEGMRAEQRDRLPPSQSHLIQEHVLHLVAPRRRGQARPGSVAIVPIPPTPTKCLPQIQRIVQRRVINNSVRGRDPKIRPRHVCVLTLV